MSGPRVDLDDPVDRIHPIHESAKPAVAVHPGVPDAIVADIHDEAVADLSSRYPDRSVRVLDASRKSESGSSLAEEVAQAAAPSLFSDNQWS